jgi:nitrogen regulatory protein P-II 1
MKRVECMIQTYMLEDVKEALIEIGVTGITITDVKGFGRQKGNVEHYRGAEYRVDFLPKIKMEMVVPDDLTDRVVNVIMTAARRGKIGDGKVFVSPVLEAYRVRTGETGDVAL